MNIKFFTSTFTLCSFGKEKGQSDGDDMVKWETAGEQSSYFTGKSCSLQYTPSL